MRIGVALIPTASDSLRLADFAYRCRNYFEHATPTIDSEHRLPHLDLITTYLGEGDEQRDLIQLVLDEYVARGRLLSRRYTARLTHIDCHPDRHVFAYLARLRWINELADAAFAAVRPFIDQNQIPHIDTAALNSHERANQMIFGTRFIGEQFVPHITLGTSLNRRLDPAITDLSDPGILGCTLTFDRIVVYAAADDGSIDRIINSRNF